MADFSPERSEEIIRLDAKAKALDGLISASEGKVLKSQNEEEVKAAIYEFLFFQLAHDQTMAARLRLSGDEANAGQMGVDIVESNQSLEAIGDGDWVTAKDDLEGLITQVLTDPDFLTKLGFDENFVYKGKAIFKPGELDSALIGDFIKNQVNLVGDKTEPYVHPRLEFLKAQLASI